MNPVKIDLINRKISVIRQELILLKKLQKKKITSKSNLITKHALCHSLQNAIAAIIDISQHIISEKTDDVPETYSESIALLGNLKILDKEFANEFSRIAKLRNVLVHLYDNINFEFIWSLLPRFIKDTKSFLKEIDRI